MTIPLEDLFNDVLAKAQRGLRLTDEDIAAAAGVDTGLLISAKDGLADEATLLKIAPVLHLHGPSLVVMARNGWYPPPIEMAGLARFNTTFGDMTVNAYVIWDPASKRAAAFDTGAIAQPMIEFIENNDLTLERIFITHTHGDHIADLVALQRGTHCQAALSHTKEPCPGTDTFDIDGTTAWSLGSLHIEPRSTHGHARGGVTYVITGLAHPVAIVGDALFASSMGGGMVSYPDALATNRKEIFTLPDDTILCPGHGPYTTVAGEKAHNPFFPEFK
jgi:glyoxylase-like metal-dependent hydrolase (beta-lactamase superfamily II)